MDVKQVLDELLAVPEQKLPIVSVYLDTRRSDEHQRESVRIFFQEESRRALKSAKSDEEQEAIRNSINSIESYLTALLRQQREEFARGVAIFCSDAIKLFRVIAVRVPFEPMQFHVGPRPYVTPFVKTCAMEPPVVIASVDSGGADLMEISCGVVDLQARVERPFPGFHSMGGWSQRNFQRHLGELRERNLRAAGDALTRVVDGNPNTMVVLAGLGHILKTFTDALPERTRDRIVGSMAAPPKGSEGSVRDALLAGAMPLVDKAADDRRRAVRDVAVSEAAREQGNAALGTDDVLMALNEGRVHKLVLDHDFAGSGWKCTSCAALSAGSQASCPFCGSPLLAVDLREDLVRRAAGEGAEIAFLPADGKLPDGKGVAAIFRPRRQAVPASPAAFERELEG